MSRPRIFLPSALPSALALALVLSPARGGAAAELGFPSASPYASVSQWVGLTNITVSYFSPAVSGRKLWGTVLTPGAPWLIGDGAAPVVSFSREVVVGGAAIPAGKYALCAIPSPTDWTIILNRQTSLWRPTDRKPALDVARFVVRAEPAPHRERLTFVFSDFADQSATLDLEWDGWRIRIPIGLRTAEQVGGAIRSLDEAWRSYADAARYMLEKKHDVERGLVYVDRSLALRETWYNVWIKASLLRARGDLVNARLTADRAYQLGRAAGAEFTLEPEVKQALADWSDAPAALAKVPAERPRRRGRADRLRLASAPGLTGQTAIVDSEPFPASSERVAAAPPAARPPRASEFAPIIKKGRPDLERCYQRALREDPGLGAAHVTVSISIGASGRVTKVALDPPPASKTLEGCLREVVARWPFPASTGDYETQVPLNLSGR
ncbi:MAG TPA: DUF2911 domain-containing protein [Polyangia bacterium]|nr:DUF2911 domain-containing protein [Polyangia bacterium]